MRHLLSLGIILLAGCAAHQPLVDVRPLSSGTLYTAGNGHGGACPKAAKMHLERSVGVPPACPTMRAGCPRSFGLQLRPSKEPSVTLGQTWTKHPAPIEATRVSFAWRPDSLLVFAEMDDRRIGSRATRDDQRTWDLGDAFEVFLQAPGTREYVEIQVTPENHRLHLRYPPGGLQTIAEGRADFPQFFMKPEEERRIQSAVEKKAHRWRVALIIPADIVSGRPIRAGTSWRFSVARYDGDRLGTPPVLSASSPHRALNFHRRSEWGTLRFISK